jgi:YHS domain-containing protein
MSMKSVLAWAVCAVALSGFSTGLYAVETAGQAQHGQQAPAAAAEATVVDVGNTKCPVTGDDVGDVTVTTQGHKYHFCCTDCPKSFKKDPEKYITKMRENPAKYGIKDASVLPKAGETKPDPDAKVEGTGGMGEMKPK